MSGGRPTSYDPKYCEMLISHAETGMSYEAFAGILGVAKKTLYNWEKEFEEFLHAKSIFRAKSLVWWEKAGIEGMWEVTEYDDKGRPLQKKKLNASVWIINMKNRHGYRDKHEVEVEQKKPFQFNYNSEDEE